MPVQRSPQRGDAFTQPKHSLSPTANHRGHPQRDPSHKPLAMSDDEVRRELAKGRHETKRPTSALPLSNVGTPRRVAGQPTTTTPPRPLVVPSKPNGQVHGRGVQPANPPRLVTDGRPSVASSAPPRQHGTANDLVTPTKGPKPGGVLARGQHRLPAPQLGDTPDSRMANTMTPGARQQQQWLQLLNYIDSLTIAINHRAKAAPSLPEEMAEGSRSEASRALGQPRRGDAAGSSPIAGVLSLGIALSPRTTSQRSMLDLHQSVNGLLHWFGLLELRHMPEGSSITDAERNLQLLGHDVLTHLRKAQQLMHDDAAGSGAQVLSFLKSQSQPSFTDCELALNRMQRDGKGYAVIRDLVAKKDIAKAKSVIAAHKKERGRDASPPGGITRSPGGTKFQQKKAMPQPSGKGQPAAVHATYPPTLVEWLERQWLPAVEGWSAIMASAQEQYNSPVATREQIDKFVGSVQADVLARQALFQEMLGPGESVPKLLKAQVSNPGMEAAKIAGRREEQLKGLLQVMEKGDFIALAAKLKEVTDLADKDSSLGTAARPLIKEAQRQLLNMQHVAKVTMSLTTAIGGGASRAGDLLPLVKALAAANQTMLDLRIASDAKRCEVAIDKGRSLIEALSATAHESSAPPSPQYATLLKSITATDFVVAHTPGGVWPADLTLLCQKAAAELGAAVDRELVKMDVKRQLQKHLPGLGGRGSQDAGAGSSGGSKTPGRQSAPRVVNKHAGRVGAQLPATPRASSTSTDMGAVGHDERSSSPSTIPGEGSHEPEYQHNTVAIEDLRALVSRSKHLGLEGSTGLQQLQRVLESATEIRFKIHFDSNIRVLGLALDRVGSSSRSPSPASGIRRSTSSTTGGTHYEPPTFVRAFDRIYTFCTGAAGGGPVKLHSPQITNFRIRYQDPDGDYITVASEEDWRVLLSDHYRGALQHGHGHGQPKGAHGRKIELFCDVPLQPQQQPQPTQQPSIQQAQPPSTGRGGASPFRPQGLFPSSTPIKAPPSRGADREGQADDKTNFSFGVKGLPVGVSRGQSPNPSQQPKAGQTKFTVQLTNAPSSKQSAKPVTPQRRGNSNATSSDRLPPRASNSVLIPIPQSDDDGTLSVIEVQDSTARRWGDGHEEEEAYDVMTMHSVETATVVAEARRLMAANNNKPPMNKQRLSTVGTLPQKRSSTNDSDHSPMTIGPSEGAPVTWQEAHGEDHDVRTIMSEETTMSIVREREAVRQQQQRKAQQPAPSVASPKAKPLSTAELNQRRALLLAQLRKQRPQQQHPTDGPMPAVVGKR